jgi:hypothetical protein
MSKIRVSRKGIRSGGRSYSRGALYELLSNPIYIGEIRHKRERRPGQQEAILERELWEKVQQRLQDSAARTLEPRTFRSVSTRQKACVCSIAAEPEACGHFGQHPGWQRLSE